MRTQGWLGTGQIFHIIGCGLLATLPVLVAVFLLVRTRFRFSLRTLFAVMTLVAIFLAISVMPLLKYQSERKGSRQLIAANATLNDRLDWHNFYSSMGLESPRLIFPPDETQLPLWLIPFAENIQHIPADDSVHTVSLSNDQQIKILATHAKRFSSLQSINIHAGVSSEGLRLLQKMLPTFDHLFGIHVSDVFVPAQWYHDLGNIHSLFVWGESSLRGTPIPPDCLKAIASLQQLEVFMVLGHAISDSDANILGSSKTIKRIIMRRTTITPQGEKYLQGDDSSRVVYVN